MLQWTAVMVAVVVAQRWRPRWGSGFKLQARRDPQCESGGPQADVALSRPSRVSILCGGAHGERDALVDFGAIDREQNVSYDRSERYEPKLRQVTSPTFAIFDMRGATSSLFNTQCNLLSKLIVLLEAILVPLASGASPGDHSLGSLDVEWADAKIFVTRQLAAIIRSLRESGALDVTRPDGTTFTPRRFSDESILEFKWVPGVRMIF